MKTAFGRQGRRRERAREDDELMVRERLLAGAVERALDKHGGNFGCSALRELGPAILAALSASDPHER